MATTNNFGIALRGWRERLSPPDADGRRFQGLRREELARLSGVSVDYVVRLEQGRARNPSAQVVSALARALQLPAAERDHLFRCAHLMPPSDGDVPMEVPVGVRRLMQRLDSVPVAVYAADWTLVSWNRMWTAVVGDPDDYGWDQRNLVAGMFRTTDGRRNDAIAAWPVRSLAGDAAEEAALVADLRETAAAYPADARLAALVERLMETSRRFAELWFGGTVGAIGGDRKTVEHPSVGSITLDLEVLMVPGSDLRVITYTAESGSSDAEKLHTLRQGAEISAAD
ncbi:helix-turn-helix transcriptional regulator [Streptacidiphilus carbonis]|jgi:transcriptional regulator with XRE-family HTH domain|uniref:helix-turn-helix transcriptional regulator n=1 Tax=Streptacidiphilus carbonis TaxID=105422 RepID=UPI0005A88BC5|nr:helix-turn-helix transcriptional regulator [Streptacidiphilus carbonis]